MNEKHMQYVLTVLKEGSFTGAAKKLYVSQPSLSQIIKAAEANLGAPIFNRNTDPITLTPAEGGQTDQHHLHQPGQAGRGAEQ